MALRVRSLRFKLAAWFVVVFGLIQTVLVLGAVLLRRELIDRSLDEGLSAAASAMIDNVLAAQAKLETDALLSLVPIGAKFELFAVRGREGQVYASWNVEDPTQLPFSGREVVPAGPIGDVSTVVRGERAHALVPGAEALRVVTLPFRYTDEVYYFQVAARDETLERFFGPVLDLVAIGVPLGLIAASIAAWTIAGRAVQPIHRLANAARAVDAAKLDRGFDVPTSDQEVVRLADELNNALARLKQRYDEQEQFIGNVSHQIKTPIAVVLTQAQVAKLGERKDERAWQFVDRTESTMQRLGRLVESFLILARADFQEDLPLEPIAVNDVLVDGVSTARAAAEARGVRVVTRLLEEDSGAVVRGDDGLLGTMLDNLLQNAIAHSTRGQEVLLQASLQRDGVHIDVLDRGPGIPPDDLERIFERFVRIVRVEGPRSGTGIGLAIARTIAVLHGGSLSASNRAEGGAAFTVVLPLLGLEQADDDDLS
ncbi:MAG: HAMP domain-containing sensor histidine kinase [Planctomycetota bacterium]